jgi:hypothetical protein
MATFRPADQRSGHGIAEVPPGLLFFTLGDVRLLLEQGVASAGLYLRVDDVRRTVEELRAGGLAIHTEPHLRVEPSAASQRHTDVSIARKAAAGLLACVVLTGCSHGGAHVPGGAAFDPVHGTLARLPHSSGACLAFGPLRQFKVRYLPIVWPAGYHAASGPLRVIGPGGRVIGYPGDALFSSGIVGHAPKQFRCDPGGRYVMFLDGSVRPQKPR